MIKGTTKDRAVGVTETVRRISVGAADRVPFLYAGRVGDQGMALSGGQAQRLAIARALLKDAPIVILDEPTSGLHFEDIKMLLGVLNRLVDDGNTVLVIEHNMEVIKNEVSSQVVPAHIHSGDTSHFSTTKVDQIKCFTGMTETAGLHSIFFTTYHSLHRLAESSVKADSIYFDEAHNSVQKGFYPAVKYYAETATRSYFFTATPKHSHTVKKPGMNDNTVYGNVIVNVQAQKLVQGGFIVPPQVVARELPLLKRDQLTSERDSEHIIQSINENSVTKVLVCAKSVKQIVRMVSESTFVNDLKERGFSYMYIAASTGAIIDGKKVTRETFFKTLNAWGADNSKKFVVMHHSILSEGINVSGLEAVIMLRAMDAIGISQTIGRVIRLHKDDAAGLRAGTIAPGNTMEYTKSYGLVIVPMFNTTQQGVARSVDKVVETVFEKGEAATSTITR